MKTTTDEIRRAWKPREAVSHWDDCWIEHATCAIVQLCDRVDALESVVLEVLAAKPQMDADSRGRLDYVVEACREVLGEDDATHHR